MSKERRVPESKGRKAADTKAANKRKGEAKERQQRNQEKLAALMDEWEDAAEVASE